MTPTPDVKLKESNCEPLFTLLDNTSVCFHTCYTSSHAKLLNNYSECQPVFESLFVLEIRVVTKVKSAVGG